MSGFDGRISQGNRTGTDRCRRTKHIGVQFACRKCVSARISMTSHYVTVLRTLTMGRSDIPSIILECLQKLEPDSQFSGGLPHVKSSSGNSYFAKVGSSGEKEQYVGEAESLKAMGAAAPGLVPNVLASGIVEESGKPYFVSEYKDLTSLTEKSGAALGRRLATEMHRCKSEKGFGFEVPTFCGATKMRNGWYGTWEECFDAMIGDLLQTLEGRGRYVDVCSKGREVRKRCMVLDCFVDAAECLQDHTCIVGPVEDRTCAVAWGSMGRCFAMSISPEAKS